MRETDPSPLDQTLARAASGDGAAWQTIVQTYTRRVYGLLLKQCRDGDLAEELTQETFVKVVRKLTNNPNGSGYREQGKFEPWLFRIAMNGLRDEMRRRGRQARPMDMSPSASAGSSGGDQASGWAAAESKVIAGAPAGSDQPFDVLARAEQVDLLRSAIASLSDADQEILHLRHTAGLSFAEIAQALDQPLGTVLARGHRALGKLKQLLNPPTTPEARTA
ncbi:MAG: sigma-70 family RNA polymerase sigma factor [Planctomycetota bacterium]